MFRYAWIIAGAAAVLSAAVGLRSAVRNVPENAAAIAQSGAAREEEAVVKGVTIPPKNVELAPNSMGEADMVGFFIYEGRCYVYMDTIWPDPGLPERYLGTVTGLIDEWTPKDGYVDLAGSTTGDFYSVKGYDPSFMLCQKSGTGHVTLYICNSGITLDKGSDLYTERLHLKERIAELQAESRDSWFYGRNEKYRIDPDCEAVESFLNALNAGSFIPREDVPAKDEWHMIFDEREKEHLYFLLEDGTAVQLRLLEGGYVFYQGILDACIQVPEDTMEAVISLAHSGERIPEDELPRVSGQRTVEECRQDPVFGQYVPEYMPEGTGVTNAVIVNGLDRETARETGTEMIYMEYCDEENPHIYYSIQIFRLSGYEKNGYKGPLLKAEELTEEALKETISRTDARGNTREYPWLDIAVEYDDVMVLLSARGLEAGECLKILESARPE